MRLPKIRWPGVAAAALAYCILAGAVARAAASGRQGEGLIGYIAKDRIVEMATAADPSVASFTPSEVAQASFVALVDPVHVRMFLVASRPADLKLAADVGRAVEAAANPALTAEFVGVAADLSEPKALISENAVTAAPEIVVYWMGSEVGRMRPEAGAAIDTDLADFIYQARTQIARDMLLDNEFFKFTFHKDLLELDCKRCHGPSGSGLLRATIRRAAERPGAALLRNI
jgi:hypothetical protein